VALEELVGKVGKVAVVEVGVVQEDLEEWAVGLAQCQRSRCRRRMHGPMHCCRGPHCHHQGIRRSWMHLPTCSNSTCHQW